LSNLRKALLMLLNLLSNIAMVGKLEYIAAHPKGDLE